MKTPNKSIGHMAMNTMTEQPVDIGSRLELFVDGLLVEKLQNASQVTHSPQPVPMASSPIRGDYMSVFKDGDRYRAYYRQYMTGYTGERVDGNSGEITCYSESSDGVEWTHPDLGICRIPEMPGNNAILAGYVPFCHNFSPFIDNNPNAAPATRFKALAGISSRARKEGFSPGGLHAFVSDDGIHWRQMQDNPVFNMDDFGFDSQNVSFWSETEGCYVCYIRTCETAFGRARSISRITSPDYIHWSDPVAMQPNLPGEHLYTSGTHPYFRAPHIYVALPTRFMPDRGSSTDILFMSSRAGSTRFDRISTEAFIRPGLKPERWGNRSNYAAFGIVPTGPEEMSIYHNRSGQRYALRTDGFVSVHTGFDQGELLTRPLLFSGDNLIVNYSTSAAGQLQIEMQAMDGSPIPGFSLEDSALLVGDRIAQTVSWRQGPSLKENVGRPVRFRFIMKECDLYSLQFC